MKNYDFWANFRLPKVQKSTFLPFWQFGTILNVQWSLKLRPFRNGFFRFASLYAHRVQVSFTDGSWLKFSWIEREFDFIFHHLFKMWYLWITIFPFISAWFHVKLLKLRESGIHSTEVQLVTLILKVNKQLVNNSAYRIFWFFCILCCSFHCR